MAVLTLTREVWLDMVAHAYDGLPEEACGFLGGDPESGMASLFHRCRNARASSRVYGFHPKDALDADVAADEQGLQIFGVMHSHTHTEAYPSPTDVEQADVPGWHYVIVSLKRPEPVVRSYLIADGVIQEEPVVVRLGPQALVTPGD